MHMFSNISDMLRIFADNNEISFLLRAERKRRVVQRNQLDLKTLVSAIILYNTTLCSRIFKIPGYMRDIY